MKMPTIVRRILNLPEPVTPGAQDATDAAAAAAEPAARSTVAPWQQLSAEADAPRRWQKAMRVLLWVVLIVFLWLGVRAAFIPRTTPAPATQLPLTATYPEVAAGGAATRFAAIYASWSQDAAQVRRDAMATVWGGDSNAGWNGKGWQTAAAPSVVAIAVESPQLARVTVVMTVTTWAKDAKGKQTNLTSRPMALQVPVSVDAAGTARVAAEPVWVAVPAVAVPAAGSTDETDSALTSQTRATGEAFFTAYGRDTDLNSLTAPGSTLSGLNGALTLSSLRQWTAHTASNDTATATAAVIWSTPNGATLAQTYTVTLRRTTSGDASRWQVLDLTTT